MNKSGSNNLIHPVYWTSEQIEILRAKYPTTNARLLSPILGKSVPAIVGKAFQLKIKANKYYRDHRISDEYIESQGYNRWSKLSLKDKYYIAGIIDGEGCICIRHYPSYKGRNPNYCSICIVNTDTQLGIYIQNTLGGHLNWLQPKESHHKKRWEWKINGLCKSTCFIKVFYPFLIVKKKKAKQLIDIFNLERRLRNGKLNCKGETNATIRRKSNTIRKLNLL